MEDSEKDFRDIIFSGDPEYDYDIYDEEKSKILSKINHELNHSNYLSTKEIVEKIKNKEFDEVAKFLINRTKYVVDREELWGMEDEGMYEDFYTDMDIDEIDLGLADKLDELYEKTGIEFIEFLIKNNYVSFDDISNIIHTEVIEKRNANFKRLVEENFKEEMDEYIEEDGKDIDIPDADEDEYEVYYYSIPESKAEIAGKELEDYILSQLNDLEDPNFDDTYLVYKDMFINCMKQDRGIGKDEKYISSQMFEFYKAVRNILEDRSHYYSVSYQNYRDLYEGVKDLLKQISSNKDFKEKLTENFENEYFNTGYAMEDQNYPEHAEVRKIIKEFQEGDYSNLDNLAKYGDFLELDKSKGESDWGYLLELIDNDEDKKKFCKILIKAGIDEEKVSDYIDEEIEELDSDEISPEIEKKIEQIHEHQEELSQKEKELQELEDKEKEKRKEGKNYGE